MRVLAACSLGGAGHLQPLRPILDAARRRGAETLVVGPPAIEPMVEETGHPFAAGGEPPEAEVAPIRERLPVVPRDEASVLGNRELFGRLATAAMVPAMDRVISDWRPDVVLRDPCEYASAMVALRRGIATAQVAIGLAEVEWASIGVAAPALEDHRPGLTDELRQAPYLVGRRFDPAQLGELPANVHVEPWADQADVLAEADVVVCHGGSGTTFGALAAGVPLVIVPLFADQYANAARVAEANAGLALDRDPDAGARRRPPGPADAAALAEAIATVRRDPSFRRHARRIAAEMARAPTVDDLLGELAPGPVR